MAKQTIAFDITVKGEQAAQQTDSLKKQLKEATLEAQALSQKFGDTSKEALAAQKKVAGLKEEMADFKQRIDALNPEAKFQAIGKLASGIAGGFGAATGAMALFGQESEDVQKALLKVQAALAISQGLNEIKGLGDAFGNFKIVALDALSGIKKAIMANPILALTAAVAAVGVAVYEWVTAEEDLTKQIEASREAEKKRYEASQANYDREIALAKALGKEVQSLERQKQLDRLATTKEQLRLIELEKNAEREKAIAYLKSIGFYTAEAAKKIREKSEEEIKLAEELKNVENDLTIQRIGLLNDLTGAAIKSNIKKQESHKQTAKVVKEEAKKEREEVELFVKTQKEVEDKPLRYYPQKSAEADRTALDNFKTQATEAADNINKFLESQTGKNIGFAADTINQNLNTVSNFMAAAEARQLDSAKGNEARQEQIRKKFFERDKKVQIAQALISTYQGATSAFASGSKLSPVAGFVAAAGAITAGLANVDKIRATQYQGGGDSGGGGGSAAPSMSGVDGSPNRLPDTNTTNINPDGTVSRNIQRPSQNNINKVYVVSSEVEGANLQNQAIVKRSTL